MLLRPCQTRPSCQYLNCLGPAQACWGITNSNMLCPMSCQSPALPHCHSLPLAMSLMKLPREHCTIINYIIIIIIAWGCPQPRCSCCHLSPSTQLRSGSSQSCSQGTHQAQHHPAPWGTQAGADLQLLEVSAEPGGTEGISLPRPAQVLLSRCLPTSLFLKSCTSPTKSRARRE